MRGASTNHRGIDIATAIGTPVVAPDDLRITFAGQKSGYGNYIEGVDGSGRQFGFGHLSQIGVAPGQTVSGGSTIGLSGNTGRSTGPHLHFQVKDANGNWLNPSDIMKNGISTLTGSVGDALGKAGDAGVAAKDAALAGLDKALESVPGIGQIWSASKAAGVPNIFTASMGECGINPICYLEKWFRETDFINRFILFAVGMILLWGAIYLLGKPVIDPMLKTAAKAALI
jgi:murein DD-endopeptidase MepM/ murein hydrolase activator NlpD